MDAILTNIRRCLAGKSISLPMYVVWRKLTSGSVDLSAALGRMHRRFSFFII